MHPQTLRTYDRLGLVVPKRTSGRGRRYTIRDVQRLRLVQMLTQEEGINLSGVRHILTLQTEVERLQRQVAHLMEEVRQTRTPASTRVFTVSSTDEVWLYPARTLALLP